MKEALAVIFYIALGLIAVISIIIVVLKRKENRVFYKPRKNNKIARPQDGHTTTYMLKGECITVTLKNLELVTEDGLVLRGYHFSPSNNTGAKSAEGNARRRVCQYLHGVKVFLPEKIGLFSQVACELKTDIIAFAYRGFGLSDGSAPYEEGIRMDIEAITHQFQQFVAREGGASKVEALLWGRSFGCCGAILAHLSRPNLHEQVVLESPFTTAQAVYKAFVPCFGGLLAYLSRMHWDNKAVAAIKAPLFLISGTKDRICPNFMAHELAEMAKQSRRLDIYDVIGGKHRALHRVDKKYWQRVRKFIDQ